MGIEKANILDCKMDCYYWLKKDRRVKEMLNERYSITRNTIKDVFIKLPSSRREDYMLQLEPKLNMMINYCDYIQHTQTGGIAYNLALLRKGVLLQAERDFCDYIRKLGDNELSGLYDKCSMYEKCIVQSESSDERDSLQVLYEQYQYKLSRELQKYGDFTNNLFVKWEDVRNSLHQNEVAIEFLTPYYSINENGDFSYNYCAVVLGKKYKEPHYITLTAKEPLDSILEENLYSSTSLYNCIWEPLNDELKGINTIYFSPEGNLHNIAIEYAMTPNKKCMNEQYKIYRLSSTREILRKRELPDIKNVSLFGGLVYSPNKKEFLSANCRIRKTRLTRRCSILPSDSLSRAGVSYLPGTKIEVENIYKISKEHNVSCNLYEDIYGTEENFSCLGDKNNDILHLATHGFFWSDDDAKRHEYLRFLSGNKFEDNSLLLSGLLLSGANITLQGECLPLDVDDGILTSQDISLIDLGRIDLVVLSACCSGLGIIKSDGVWGLQRGFKISGAKSLLMSLWPVDDEATQLLMIEFYKNYLMGETKINSLYKAQHYVKHVQGFEDADYWAGWILLDALN